MSIAERIFMYGVFGVLWLAVFYPVAMLFN
jgi:hypothetical protein